MDGFNVGDFESWDEWLPMRSYTADFETTTDPDDCRVWAFAACAIESPEMVVYGNSIEDFISWGECVANARVYFHNLAFDGAFLMTYLETHGWKWVDKGEDIEEYTYTTLISDTNMVYNINLYYTPSKKIVIYDSLKILPMTIKKMAKAFNLPIAKGELDYEAYREPGHILTPEEKEYIKYDVQIAAMSLKVLLDQKMTKMTAGSNALYGYKTMMGGSKQFRKIYPILDAECDDFVRKAYRGGFTYVNPKYAGKVIGEGIVFDVNSLYPSVLAACDGQALPYGEPIWFDGEYEEDVKYPLWVGMVTFKFDIKPDHIPSIQIKGNFRFGQNEYIEHSNGEVTIAVTSIDWKLILQQYDVRMVRWHGGYKFKANRYQFKEYVEYWTKVKVQATEEGNSGLRQLAKLMLNSLYGKFATRTKVLSRRPMMKDGVLHYVDLPEEEREPVYLPVGVFTTAYARYKTITSAQSVYDRFIYADTDSLHLLGTEVPDALDVHPTRLGAWKHESTFDGAKFLRQKCYVEHEVGADKLTVHVSGLPLNCHDQVSVENFDFGAVYTGKLYQKRVKGGIVLVPGDMVIRE